MNVLSVWGKVQRKWGYEVRVDFIEDGKIYNEQLLFSSEPTKAELDAEVLKKQKYLETLLAPVPEPEAMFTVTNEDGSTTIL